MYVIKSEENVQDKNRFRTCPFKHGRLNPCSNHQDLNNNLNFVLFTSWYSNK